MDARRLKKTMAVIVAKQLVAAWQLHVQEVRFRSHGAMVSVSVEGWKYIAWVVERDGMRACTLEGSVAHMG